MEEERFIYAVPGTSHDNKENDNGNQPNQTTMVLTSAENVMPNCQCYKEIMNGIDEKFLNFKQELTKDIKEIMTNVTATVIQLRKEVRSTVPTSASGSGNILSQSTLPFKSLEDFIKFEEELVQHGEKFAELEKAFLERGSSEPQQFIKGFLKLLFKDDVAKTFSWVGKNNKKAARSLRTIGALKNAFHTKFPGTSEDVFDKWAMRHFHYAMDRISKRNKYEAKK